MKETMTNCILHIAIYVGLIFVNIISLGFSIIGKDWGDIIFFSTFTILFIISLVCEYKKCKRIEENMQSNIRSLMNLQAFALLRMTFENHPDFNPNGFGAKPKDKEDEVETDK